MPIFDQNAWRREQQDAERQYAQNLMQAALMNRQWQQRQGMANQDFQQRLYQQQMQARLAEQAAQQEHLRRLGLMDVQQQYGSQDAWQQQQYGLDRMKVQNQYATQAGAADYARELEKMGLSQGYNVENQQLQDELLRGRMGMEQQYGLERAAFDDQLRAGQAEDAFGRDMTKMQFGEIANAEQQRRAAEIDRARMAQQNQFTMQRDTQQNFYSQQESRVNFLRQQYGQIKQAVGQLGQQSARFNPEGKPKWEKVKQKLASLDDAYRKGQLREDLYLEEYARVGNEIQTEPWAEYVQKPGTLPGDTTYKGQWEYTRMPDGTLANPVLRQDWSQQQHEQYDTAQTLYIRDPNTQKPIGIKVPRNNGSFDIIDLPSKNDDLTAEQYLKFKQAADNYNLQNTDDDGNPIGRQVTTEEFIEGFLQSKRAWKQMNTPQQSPPNGAPPPPQGGPPTATGQQRADAYGQAIQEVDPNLRAFYAQQAEQYAQDFAAKAQAAERERQAQAVTAPPPYETIGGVTGGMFGIPSAASSRQTIQNQQQEKARLQAAEERKRSAYAQGKKEIPPYVQQAKAYIDRIRSQFQSPDDVPESERATLQQAIQIYTQWANTSGAQ